MSPVTRRRAARIFRGRNSKYVRYIGEDTLSLPPHLTYGHFEGKMSASKSGEKKNYLFKCLETISGQWHINHFSLNRGWFVYRNAVHLGQNITSFYSAMAKKKKGSKFTNENLKFSFFFSLLSLLPFFKNSNPSVNVSASSWYAPRWKVKAIPLKSSSSQNYHFISSPAKETGGAGPLLTALGISLFIVCKLCGANVVAWENGIVWVVEVSSWSDHKGRDQAYFLCRRNT